MKYEINTKSLAKLISELNGLKIKAEALPTGIQITPDRSGNAQLTWNLKKCDCNCDCVCLCRCGEHCDCKCDCDCQCKCDCDCDERMHTLDPMVEMWTPARKMDVVRLVLRGRKLEEVAKKYEIPGGQLAIWIDAYKSHGPAGLRS